MGRIKKKLLLCSAIISGFALISAPAIANVYAAEEDPVTTITETEPVEPVDESAGDEEPAEEEFECKVVERIGNGGNVLFTITEGHVGDKVIAYVNTDFLYEITSVNINGVSASISPDKKYEFTLIEGDNIFEITFAISNERVSEIVNLIDTAKANGIESLFTMNNLINLIAWAIAIFLSSGFLITLIKSKKLKSKTTEEIVEVVKTTLQSEEAQILKKFLEQAMGKTLDKITSKMDNVDECIKVLCRCMVLAQEDTPESKLAIIEELTKLNNNEKDLTAQVRAIIQEEQIAQQQAIIERDNAIEELKKTNESLTSSDKGEEYGQI